MDRLAAMETFVRVVETGSFSEAARQLHVGQPAVSKTIAQLEDRLGVKLLLRSTRGLMPTEAGENFFQRAKCSIEEADEADLAARGAGASLSGRLRVSAATTFASLHVIPHLPKFLAEHPDLDMEVILDDRQIDLVEEGIDISLRMGELADSSLTARKIGQARRLVVGAPSYFEKVGEPKIPSELVAHESIIYAKGPGRDVWRFRKDSSEISVTVRGRLRRRRRPIRSSCRDRALGRVRMDVRTRARLGRSQGGADGLDHRADRSLGGVPGRPNRQCQGPRLRGFRRDAIGAGTEIRNTDGGVNPLAAYASALMSTRDLIPAGNNL